jgi:hypothetical protein
MLLLNTYIDNPPYLISCACGLFRLKKCILFNDYKVLIQGSLVKA